MFFFRESVMKTVSPYVLVASTQKLCGIAPSSVECNYFYIFLNPQEEYNLLLLDVHHGESFDTFTLFLMRGDLNEM